MSTEPKDDDDLFAAIDAALAAELVKPQTRTYKPMSDETRELARLRRLDPHPPVRAVGPVGRPKGARNKPKPPGYVRPPRPPRKSLEPLTRITAQTHFKMINGAVWRLVRGHPDRVAQRKLHGKTSRRGFTEPWIVQLNGYIEPATTVAWWLIHNTAIPEGHVVICKDVAYTPKFTIDTLDLAAIPVKKGQRTSP